jgi:VanZ family protein
MNYRKFLKYWFPVILWVSVTFWMSSGIFSASNTSRIIETILRYLTHKTSETEVDLIDGVIRKISHLTEYFVLGLLLFRGFRSDSTDVKAWRWVLYSLLVLTLFAAGDEFHQSFDPTRTSSLVDAGIDILGGVLAQPTILLWNRFNRSDP